MIFNYLERKVYRIIEKVLLDFYERKLMATIEEVTLAVTTLSAGIAEIKTKLDSIAALVMKLEGGAVATQEQIDALSEAVGSAQSLATSVASVEDTIK